MGCRSDPFVDKIKLQFGYYAFIEVVKMHFVKNDIQFVLAAIIFYLL